MLYELCLELNNFFEQAIYIGDVTISNNDVTPDMIQTNQYFRIVGSVFNDGVYKKGDANLSLTDETYHGGLWAMAVPKEVIALSNDIDAWKAKYATTDSEAMSPYRSESFGGYSYTKGAESGDTTGSSWKNAFADRLKLWRKLK